MKQYWWDESSTIGNKPLSVKPQQAKQKTVSVTFDSTLQGIFYAALALLRIKSGFLNL